jgi:hypothetical protein
VPFRSFRYDLEKYEIGQFTGPTALLNPPLDNDVVS